MKIRHRTGRRAVVAALAAAALTLASTAVVLPGANADVAPALAPAVLAAAAPSGVVPLTPQGAPQTIPGLAAWTSAAGEFTLGAGAKVVSADAVLAGQLAEQLSEVLGRTVTTAATGALAGDVMVAVDPSRSAALGEEGYELVVGDTLKVTGATDTGAFYGGQTILQLLVQGNRIAKGTSIDVPKYVERGVGLCACQLQISMESLERTMKDMAYNKMNQLWLETKLKSDAYPKANFWSYYTKAEAAQITAWAKKYHIELVLEVNSPGHMRPWLYNYPELQLVNNAGQKKENQLDITKPEALEMLKTLIDEYAVSFPDQPYWHMGGDEYMINDGYENYSQFAAFVAAHPEIFPAGSGPGDVFIWYMNQVNTYVKSTGKKLRIWNDGIPASSTVKLDSDITVEFWYKGKSPAAQAVLNAGHDVQNASQAFYFNRPGNYSRDLNNLWNNGWTPHTMDGGAIVADVPGKGKVLGAKLSAWPDESATATEAEVEEQISASMRFLAQANWGGPKPTADYAKFSALSTSLGRVPGYNSYDRTPVGDGGYSIATAGKSVNGSGSGMAVTAEAAQAWQFAATSDNYYKITAENGKCLTMDGGVQWLKAPMEQNLAASLVDCTSSDRRTNNLQKWEILSVDGGFKIRNAITQMPLSVNAAGVVTQEAADVRAPSVFTLVGAVSTSIQAPSRVVAGAPATVSVTLENRTASGMTGTVVTPTVPNGWSVAPATVAVGNLAAGASKTVAFTVTPPKNASYGSVPFSSATSYTMDGKAEISNAATTALLSCSGAPVRPVAAVVDSFNNGQGEVTPGSNAIDGDPNTFWGTAWTPSDAPLPHTIQVDLGKELSLCAINLLPRQGSSSGAANGRILGYELYLSDSADKLGAKIAEGEFPNAAAWQVVVLDELATGRFLTLKALSEQKGNPWTTLAELNVDGFDPADVPTAPATTAPPTTAPPTTDPTTAPPTVDPTTAPPTTDPTTAPPTTDPTTAPPTVDPTTAPPTVDPTTDPTETATTDPGATTPTATGSGTTTPSATTSAPAAGPGNGGLAETGANTMALWGGALLMTLLGAVVVFSNRRRAGLHK